MSLRRPNRWLVLAVLTLTVVLSYADRVLLAALAPLIQNDFALSDTQLGVLTGAAFALFFAAAGVPIGRLADRVNRSRVVAGAIVVWSLMTAGCGLAGNFVQLLLFRFGVGAGEAGGTPPSHSLLSDLFPPERRGTVLAIFHSGWAFGMAAGLAVGGWIGQEHGWRTAFAAVGLSGLVVAVLVLWLAPDPRTGPASAEMPDLAATARQVFANRPLVRLIITAGVGNIAFTAVTTWISVFFVRSHHMSVAEAGGFVGGVMGFGILPGLLMGGWAADLLARRDARRPMYVLVGAALACAMFFAGALWSPGRELALACICGGVFAGTLTSAPLMAYIQNVSPPHLRATSSALVGLTNAVLGGGLGPLLAGGLSDAFAPAFGAESLRIALTLSLAPHLVYAVLLLGMPKLLPVRFAAEPA